MASILIIDDEVPITEAFGTFFRTLGYTVHAAHTGAAGVDAYFRLRPDLVLLDVRLPDITGFDVLDRIRSDHPVVVMITGYGDVEMAVEALHKGAENFLMKPVDLSHLEAATRRALEKAELRRLHRVLTGGHRGAPGTLLGTSPAMRELDAQCALLAASERTTGLIVGERGAGKGRVAELVHARSARAARPFVQVNCAALTPEGLEAELFGVDGRDGRRGLVDAAAGGTLFLDEVSELAPSLQPRLLRLLEGKGFRRVGGNTDLPADVRVLAASSRDLSREVAAGRIREDLYYRLAVMPLVIPPLRTRSREDVVELVGDILDELAPALAGAPARLEEDALEAILRHAWPGNIRELRNALERAMLLARGRDAIALEHLPREVVGASGAHVAHHEPRSLAEVEKAHIDRTLRWHQHNRTHAARELGISRATLIKKIREYALDEPARDRG